MSTAGMGLGARLRDPKVILGVLSLALVMWLTFKDLGRTSPGPLTSAHLQVDALKGGAACDACHGGGGLLRADRSLAAACGDCHEGIGKDIAAMRGLHGSLGTPNDCGECHVEHHGDEIALVSDKVFAAAGIADLASFDHAMVDFLLEGRHGELDCGECHSNAEVLLLPEGERRYHGLQQSCETCHEDPHRGQMVPACVECHGQTKPFAEVATFEHYSFQLDGAHGEALCSDCHAPEGVTSIAELASQPRGQYVSRSCGACHEDPHAPQFTNGVAAFLGLTPASTCSTCHSAEHSAFALLGNALTGELHAAGGFELEGAHGEAACDACHLPDARDFRDIDSNCASCHRDAHAGRSLAAESFLGQSSTDSFEDCARCHDQPSFSHLRGEAFDHARDTSFPLENAHAQADCIDCHKRSAQADENGRKFGRVSQLFGQPVDACVTCHADPHVLQGEGLSFPLEADLVERDRTCSLCHGTRSFELEDRGFFAHGKSTGFVLDGAHERAACEACHLPRKAPDALGRSFGLVSATADLAASACANCHVGPHRGGIVPAQKGLDCARCHTSEAFSPHRSGEFDHGIDTQFPLTGVHTQVSCDACHARLPVPNFEGRTLERAAGAQCADCHGDPHLGQFRSTQASDCESCHATDGTASLFDHQSDARFKLDEQHAPLECSACHKRSALRDGRETVRYKPLGILCADCHLRGGEER